ncbi:MAG: hypothetical protein WB974_11780, partial [Acidobacteriaceae bacterium]
RPALGDSLLRTTAWMLPAGLLALGSWKRRGGKNASLWLLAVLLSLTVGLTACSGGGGSTSGGGGGGTTPVTGTVTVTAAGSTGNVTQTTPVTVTVD